MQKSRAFFGWSTLFLLCLLGSFPFRGSGLVGDWGATRLALVGVIGLTITSILAARAALKHSKQQ